MKLYLSIRKYKQMNTYHIIIGDYETKQFYVSYYANILDYNDRDILLFIANKQGQKRYIGCIDNYILMNGKVKIYDTDQFMELFIIDQRIKELRETYGKDEVLLTR